MKKTYLAILAFTTLSMVVVGQGLTLRQCVEFANSNNAIIKNATLDIQIADRKIDEQSGTMLPQIDGTSSYTNNIQLPTTILPGSFNQKNPGTPLAVTMGIKQNISGSIQLNQKLFDPTFDVALKAVKISKAQSIQSKRKSLEQTAYTICGIYYQTLVIGKQIATLHTTMEAAQKSLEATELKFRNGMAKKVDVDKIKVSYNNIKSQSQQSELSYLQSLNNLKYQMGMTVETPLILSTDAIEGDIRLFEMPENNFSIDNRVDYQLQKINLSAYELDKKRHKDSYLPTLTFNANLGIQAMRQEFDFFKTDGNWYPNSSVGLTLKVPIFDGLQKQARISQAQLNIQKSKISIQQTEEAIKVDLSNNDIQYRNAIDNIKNEKDNLDLAESVYKNFQNQFKQGICSTLDLVQAQSSYSESQNIYYNKLLTLYIARINLEQTKGTLINYINNQK